MVRNKLVGQNGDYPSIASVASQMNVSSRTLLRTL